MRLFLCLLSCTILPYSCDASCNCLEIAKYKKGQWEYLLKSELQLGTDPDAPIIYFIGGCCCAYAEVIEALERAQQSSSERD